MTGPAARRLLRASLSGATLVLLTLAGHAAGSGSLPGPLGLAIATVLAFGLAFATGARQLAPMQLLGFLLGGQILLHLVLVSAGGHAHGAAPGPGTAAMIAGHVAAAVIAAVLLDQADQLIDRWVSFWATALGATPLIAGAPQETRRLRATPIAPASSRSEHLQHYVVRRGPPAPVGIDCS
ncbi:MAG: hypothetical protein NTX29_13500 [Actinobacteria bacterium]|nr:hypothetical protein [Actinomycetota bacterium]